VIVAESVQMLLGSLPAWLTLVTVAVIGYYFVKGAGGAALTTLETANRILEGRVHTLEAQAKDDAKLIAELKARTDLSVQLQPLVQWTGEHENRDQQRFEKTIAAMGVIETALGEIADRLNPTQGGTT
jgi:chaperonin cofactor prefoldin